MNNSITGTDNKINVSKLPGQTDLYDSSYYRTIPKNKFKLGQKIWIVRAAIKTDELISFIEGKIIEIYSSENETGIYIRYEVLGYDQWTIDQDKVFLSKNDAIDSVIKRLSELKS